MTASFHKLTRPVGGRMKGATDRGGQVSPPNAALREMIAQAVTVESERLAESMLQRVLTELRRPSAAPTVRDEDSIDQLPLPPRVAKVMRINDVRTVAQLTALSEADISYLRNIGSSSLDQLKRILGLYGRRLADRSASESPHGDSCPT